MKSTKILIVFILLLFSIIACNMPFEQVAPPGEVQTAAALTLQAISTPSLTSTASTPIITNTTSPRVTETASTDSLTGTLTPTYSVPMLTVREQTNCRTGPGEDYEIIFTYLSGKKLEIAGRYDPGNFWLVRSNESPTGNCWLWGEYVEVTGSYWAVSSVTPPPTATERPPQQPSIVEWNFFCTGSTINFTVTWTDRADNETGYRIFRNGELLVELPVNSTVYTDSFTPSAGQNAEYYIQVYGANGSVNSSAMRMSC